MKRLMIVLVLAVAALAAAGDDADVKRCTGNKWADPCPAPTSERYKRWDAPGHDGRAGYMDANPHGRVCVCPKGMSCADWKDEPTDAGRFIPFVHSAKCVVADAGSTS